MHTHPGIPWDGWLDLPYDLVMGCIQIANEIREGRLGG